MPGLRIWSSKNCFYRRNEKIYFEKKLKYLLNKKCKKIPIESIGLQKRNIYTRIVACNQISVLSQLYFFFLKIEATYSIARMIKSDCNLTAR